MFNTSKTTDQEKKLGFLTPIEFLSLKFSNHKVAFIT
jgi:hypothetical protein